MKNGQKGFTLVEIAIVLVIIGLLLGGILKGQEMITQAKIKNAIADFSGVSAAYHGYYDRYRKLPGDDNGAATRWTDLTAATDNGDGNGTVAGTYNAASSGNTESVNFWLHLRKSGFVAGSGKDQPTNALTGMLGVQTGDGAATIGPALGKNGTGANGMVGLLLCSANIPDKISIAIDTQMDDGIADTGTVRGQQQTAGPNPAIAAQGAAAYAETGSNLYAICRQI